MRNDCVEGVSQAASRSAVEVTLQEVHNVGHP